MFDAITSERNSIFLLLFKCTSTYYLNSFFKLAQGILSALTSISTLSSSIDTFILVLKLFKISQNIHINLDGNIVCSTPFMGAFIKTFPTTIQNEKWNYIDPIARPIPEGHQPPFLHHPLCQANE